MKHILALLVLTISGTYSQNNVIEEAVPVGMRVIRNGHHFGNLNQRGSNNYLQLIVDYNTRVTTEVYKQINGTNPRSIPGNPVFRNDRYEVQIGYSRVVVKFLSNHASFIKPEDSASGDFSTKITLDIEIVVSCETKVISAFLLSPHVGISGEEYGVTAHSNFKLLVQPSWEIKIQEISSKPIMEVLKNTITATSSFDKTASPFSVTAEKDFFFNKDHITQVIGQFENRITHFLLNALRKEKLGEKYTDQMKMIIQKVAPPRSELPLVEVKPRETEKKTIEQGKILLRIAPGGHPAPEDARTL